MKSTLHLIIGCLGFLPVVTGCKVLDAGEENKASEGWELTPVMVFSEDIAEGTTIEYDHVAKMGMPEKFVTPSMVKPRDFEKVLGQKLGIPCSRGDLVLWQFFASGGAFERLSNVVKKNARAISLPVPDAAGVAGWVRPNDHVDILVTYTDPKTNQSKTSVLLQDVIVMAVGSVSGTSMVATMDPDDLKSDTVTVYLLPAEARMVAWATQNGKLHLALRNPADTSSVDEKSETSLETIRDTKLKETLRKERQAR